MNDQLTPWFPKTVVPVHPGVYETRLFTECGLRTGYSRWDGASWSYQSVRAEQAEATSAFNRTLRKEWRGFTKEQK